MGIGIGLVIGFLSGMVITALFANPANMYDKGYEDAMEVATLKK
ncbi:hypothetical protein [Vagococcus xieshaowenii]|nr:hypothetical protein [Vagococcus xieshaowenii]